MTYLTIKFSEDYGKLPLEWEDTDAILTGVLVISLDKFKTTSPAFIEYDTKYRGKEGSYDLNFAHALILSPDPPNPNEAPFDERLDDFDISIIETMLNNGCADLPQHELSTNEILTLTTQIDSWRGVNDHLLKLKSFGYVRCRVAGQERIYDRNKKKVISQRKILWTFNLKKH